MRSKAMWLLFSCFATLGVMGSEHDKYQRKVPLNFAPQHYGSIRDDLQHRRLDVFTDPTVAMGTLTCPQIAAQANWGPIRIGFDIAEISGSVTDSTVVSYVSGTLIPEAIKFFDNVIQVRRASAPLYFSRPCTQTTAQAYPFAPEQCVQYAEPTCGSDNVQVPEKYWSAVKTCKQCRLGINGCTSAEVSILADGSRVCNKCDMALWAQKRETYDCKSIVIPPENLPASYCPSNCTIENAQFYGTGYADPDGNTNGILCEGDCEWSAPQPGAANEDFHVFVTIAKTTSCTEPAGAGAGSLAYATSCSMDQCDRPVFGHVNICINNMVMNPGELGNQTSTLIHEFIHALVFSSTLMPYYRDANGNPLIPRGANSFAFPNAVPFTYEEIDDPPGSNDNWQVVYNWNVSNGIDKFVDLSGKIYQNFVERDLTDCQCPYGTDNITIQCFASRFSSDLQLRVPTCSLRVILPNVLSHARTYWNCSELPGMELENQPTMVSELGGSHWEQRVFSGELMTSVFANFLSARFLSTVTLALFEDSGWYKPDYTKTDFLVYGQNFGYLVGCEAAMNKCVIDGISQYEGVFCTEPPRKGVPQRSCSFDGSTDFACGLSITNLDKNNMGYELPLGLTFTADSTASSAWIGKEGIQSQMDYCPGFVLATKGRNCIWGNVTMPVQDANYAIEMFGDTSSCMITSLNCEMKTCRNAACTQYSKSGLQSPSDSKRFWPFGTTSGCYGYSCAEDSLSYTLYGTVGLTTGRQTEIGVIGTCTEAEQLLTYPGCAGSIECWDPYSQCANALVKHNSGDRGFTSETETRTGTETTTVTFGTGTSLTGVTQRSPAPPPSAVTTSPTPMPAAPPPLPLPPPTTTTTTTTPTPLYGQCTLDVSMVPTPAAFITTATTAAIRSAIAKQLAVNTFSVLPRLTYISGSSRRLATVPYVLVQYTVYNVPASQVAQVEIAQQDLTGLEKVLQRTLGYPVQIMNGGSQVIPNIVGPGAGTTLAVDSLSSGTLTKKVFGIAVLSSAYAFNH